MPAYEEPEKLPLEALKKSSPLRCRFPPFDGEVAVCPRYEVEPSAALIPQRQLIAYLGIRDNEYLI